MNLLVIEDEPNFIARLKAAFAPEGSPNQLFTPHEVGLVGGVLQEGISFEEQFLAKLRRIHEEQAIDLVLLDTDLSRFLGSPISQTICRQALQEIGVPVCRYKKSYAPTDSNRLKDLKRIAREGASAIWVPSRLVKAEELTELVAWLAAIEDGFKQIRQRLEEDPALLAKPQGPAGILARVLARPKLRADLLGYTAQNLFFFAAPLNEDSNGVETNPDVLVQSTRLGYWLFNYILTFPGPIMPAPAAAALLNLDLQSFTSTEVLNLVESAKYAGPFHRIQPFYWRDKLNELIDEAGGDIAASKSLAGVELDRLEADPPGTHAYYCVLSDVPITGAEAANPSPDWIPPGADITRINQDLLDTLDPMLSK